MRLHSILKNDIENYDSVDLITFNFKSGDKSETVKIKDDRLLESEKI